MKTHTLSTSAWVADDGSFGQGLTLLFNPSDLTPEQWDELSNLPDNQKITFVLDCLNPAQTKS